MPKWTKAQNDAVNTKNRNILVSAAAGSGKTAVLVGRVIRMITDPVSPVDVDKLLIVTFTNAAAAEMRSRISLSLKEILKNNPNDSNARRQLSLLGNAKICTIDSFCISLVRENFFDLGISNDFRNMDESEISLLKDAIINDVIDEYFEADDPDFID
ncbi:MAG: UvrD-helicase domain-containing protein, partial [Clostridiales bacterium]|nr:UvrD-helicase domain-containing protein [Clostridiales bacterium]